jgi:ubiquitin carboxyl-terminal hydrolase L5
MDMLNGDFLLSNEATPNSKGKKRKANEGANDNESGFHFIAFMPIDHHLWKLDGLERQPMCLGMKTSSPQYCPRALTHIHSIGAFEDDWLGLAKPDIEARMAQYEEGQIEFSILSLVRDPLLDLVPKLAENIKSIAELSARLDLIKQDWREFETSSINRQFTGLLAASDSTYELTPQQFDRADLPIAIAKLCKSDVVEDVMTQRQQLVTDQARLRLWIRDEQQSNQSDEERAAARRCDYGAMMQNFVRKVKAKRKSLDESEVA